MGVPFYDNLEATPIDVVSCLVEVERVYGLDWARFGEEHWEVLARLYEGLPGAAPRRAVVVRRRRGLPALPPGVGGADRIEGFRHPPRGRLAGVG